MWNKNLLFSAQESPGFKIQTNSVQESMPYNVRTSLKQRLWKTKRTMKFGFGKFIVNFFNVMTEFFDRDIAKLNKNVTSFIIFRFENFKTY